MKDNSRWRNVINLKYGSEEGGWFPIIQLQGRLMEGN